MAGRGYTTTNVCSRSQVRTSPASSLLSLSPSPTCSPSIYEVNLDALPSQSQLFHVLTGGNCLSLNLWDLGRRKEITSAKTRDPQVYTLPMHCKPCNTTRHVRLDNCQSATRVDEVK